MKYRENSGVLTVGKDRHLPNTPNKTMIPIVKTNQRIQFSLTERSNIHCRNSKEWVLKCCINGKDWWTIKTYDRKPNKKEYDEDKDTVIRSMKVYHQNLRIPLFELTQPPELL